MIYGPGQKRPTSGQSPYLKFLEQNASKWQGVADQVLNPDSMQKSAPRIGQEANLDAAILKGGLATAKQGNTAAWQKYQQPNEGVLRAGLSNKIDKFNLNIAGGNSQLQKQTDDLNYNRVNMSPEEFAQRSANIEKRRGEILDYNKQYTLGNVEKTQNQIARSKYVNDLLGQATNISDTSPLVAAINSYGASSGAKQQIATAQGELAKQIDVNRPTGAVAQQIANQKAVDDTNSAIYKERGDQKYGTEMELQSSSSGIMKDLQAFKDSGMKGKGNFAKIGEKYGLSNKELNAIWEGVYRGKPDAKKAREVLEKSQRNGDGKRGKSGIEKFGSGIVRGLGDLF